MDSVVEMERTGASENRRRAYRQTFVCKGMLYRDNRAAGPQRVTLQDVSLLGVGFEATAPVETGTRCRVQIELGPTKIVWRLRVVCCGKVDDTLYRIGCDFVPAELDLYTDQGTDAATADENAVLILT
jgi:hypothetical protein